MKIAILTFTEPGIYLAKQIATLPDFATYTISIETLCSTCDTDLPKATSLSDWTRLNMEADALIYIGATQIAVRAIAPYLKDKLTDPAILVLDEQGHYCIPICAGHVGGANELCTRLADAVGSKAVITTASDRRAGFAVDVFATKQHLHISNRKGIAAVASKHLAGMPLTCKFVTDASSLENLMKATPDGPASDVIITSWLPDSSQCSKADRSGTLLLATKPYVLGIGCKKGKTETEIHAAITTLCAKAQIQPEQIALVYSIAVKKEEAGILGWCQTHRIPYETASAEQLNAVPGTYTGSDFVKTTVGVDNVCERASVYGSYSLDNTYGTLTVDKQEFSGITLALTTRKLPDYEALFLARYQASMQPQITVIGMGPGNAEAMTEEAVSALDAADVIVGYTTYVRLLPLRYHTKEILTTGMKQEVERCHLCFRQALSGKRVALICSGDAGIYGMASLLYELQPDYPSVEIRVIPGITAALSGAAALGAPLNHDCCLISLSDLLTPWEVIERRLRAAAQGDFAIALYNPSSKHRPDHLARACAILLEILPPNLACGYVRNIGRAGMETHTCTLQELAECKVDMFTTVIVGNRNTIIRDGKLITPRGYKT